MGNNQALADSFVSSIHRRISTDTDFRMGLTEEFLKTDNEVLVTIINELAKDKGEADNKKLARFYAVILADSNNPKLQPAPSQAELSMFLDQTLI